MNQSEFDRLQIGDLEREKFALDSEGKVAVRVIGETGVGGDGDVIAPATNTADYIPQWNGADSKTLKNGLALDATISGETAANTSVPSTMAVETFVFGEIGAFESAMTTALGGKSDIGHNHDAAYAPVLGTDDNYVTDAEKVKLSNLSGTNSGDETTTTLGTKIAGATAKATPVDADNFGYADSAASNVLKKFTWANLKAALKSYFDTLYQATLVSGTNIKTINSTSLLGSGNIAISGGSLPFEVVVANDAPTAWKNAATRQCDGTADNVEIQAAIDALTAGGIILLSPGTYNLAVKLTFSGNDTYNSPTKCLWGAGMHTTRLNMASGVDGIYLTNHATVSVKDLGIRLAGAGNGITAVKSGTLWRSFWNSEFRNLYIDTSAAHTGWAISMGSPFRSVFQNLEVFQTHHGFKFYSEDANFNPGDCTVDRCFIELDSSVNSIGLQINSPTGMGSMNQMTFNMVELIDNAAGGTAILLDGAAGSNHNQFTGINVEEFATVLDIDYGFSNVFEFNYINALAGGTFFKTQADAANNWVRKAGIMMVGAKTNTIINDANTWSENPNKFENLYIAIETGGVANATVVTGSTKLGAIRGYNSGTMNAPLKFSEKPQEKRTVSVLLNDSTALTSGDGKAYWRVPDDLGGWRLKEIRASRVAGTGTPSFQVHNLTQASDMLTTNVTIDSGETDSSTAATAAVISTTLNDVAAGDRIRFDVDAAGTSTTWAEVQLVFSPI